MLQIERTLQLDLGALKIFLNYFRHWKRAVWGIPSTKCPRCMIEDENMGTYRRCESTYRLLRKAIRCISFIMTTEGLVRELTRGLINEKWLNSCKNRNQKSLLRLILDDYLNNIKRQLWIERCNETIELKKQMGIIKDLKRKKKRTKDSSDDGERDLEKLEKQKNNKKIKNILKIDLEEKTKDDVFRLGDSNRFKIANQVISNLVNT
ncbi:hypothetical protein C1646_755354 [Rhizophagus diaphanus]|nr:hypothetical protein C1646_755354 [Rhizophagus diaphanus] [Rhizophagus sp. MUCL 43196]